MPPCCVAQIHFSVEETTAVGMTVTLTLEKYDVQLFPVFSPCSQSNTYTNTQRAHAKNEL